MNEDFPQNLLGLRLDMDGFDSGQKTEGEIETDLSAPGKGLARSTGSFRVCSRERPKPLRP